MEFDTFNNWIAKFKSAKRAEQAFMLFSALIGLPAGLANIVPGWADWLKSNAKIDHWVLICLPILAFALFLYAAIKTLREPPDIDPKPLKRPALKGGEKYTKDDGKLFLRLGRTNVLKKLCALIADAENPIIAVQADSGAGKSSLPFKAVCNSFLELVLRIWIQSQNVQSNACTAKCFPSILRPTCSI